MAQFLKVFAFLFLTSNISPLASEPQHVRFYQGTSSCTSQPTWALSGSSSEPVNGSTFSSMSFLGMWQVWSCQGQNPYCQDPGTTYLVNYKPSPYCVGRKEDHLYQFKMIGDPNQRAPELYLYTSRDFSGQKIKATDVISWTSLTTPISIKSYIFTGNYEWGLYSESNFKGKTVICLRPFSQVVHQGYGFTFDKVSETFVIKSVKFGCNVGSSITLSISLIIMCILSMSI